MLSLPVGIAAWSPNALDQFCFEGGVKRGKVGVVSIPGKGRGLIATEDISANDLIIQIPLHTRTMRLRQSAELDENDNWAGVLAAEYLCLEFKKGDESRWKPYLDSLPETPPRVPHFWSQADQEELQNSTLIHLAQQNELWRQQQWERHRSVVGQQYEHLFYRMLGLVLSRTFLKQSNGSRMLAPLIDLANHETISSGGCRFMVGQKTMDLYAGDKDICLGEAICLDYSHRLAEDFLLYYGFIPDHVPTDAVQVPLPNGATTTVGWKDVDSGKANGEIDLFIQAACQRMLKEFSTTIEEDRALLRSCGTTFSDFRIAVEYRLAKKHLLAAVANFKTLVTRYQ